MRSPVISPAGATRSLRSRRSARRAAGSSPSIARRSCWSRCSRPLSARLSARRCRSSSSWAFGALVPLPIVPSVHPTVLMLSVLYGLLTALAFALWPLGRAARHFGLDVVPRPGADAAELAAPALRDRDGGDRRRCSLRWRSCTAYDRRLATIFVGAAAIIFVMLRLVALLTMALARRLPRPRIDALCGSPSPTSTGRAR